MSLKILVKKRSEMTCYPTKNRLQYGRGGATSGARALKKARLCMERKLEDC